MTDREHALGDKGELRKGELRSDYQFIVDTVREGSRVLDLGCGEGTLLKMLIDRKGVRGTGIEIVEERVYEAVEKGSPSITATSEGLHTIPTIPSTTLLSQTCRPPTLCWRSRKRCGWARFGGELPELPTGNLACTC